MAKHTPGPWEPHWNHDRWEIGNYTDSPHVVAFAADAARLGGVDISPGEANARLMSAAPELLTACAELIRHFCGSTDKMPPESNKWFRFALTAIAKAKGAKA